MLAAASTATAAAPCPSVYRPRSRAVTCMKCGEAGARLVPPPGLAVAVAVCIEERCPGPACATCHALTTALPCAATAMHLECAASFLQEIIPTMRTNTAAKNKYEVRRWHPPCCCTLASPCHQRAPLSPSHPPDRCAVAPPQVLARQRPKYFMQAERVPCPAGTARAKTRGGVGCSGFTVGERTRQQARAVQYSSAGTLAPHACRALIRLRHPPNRCRDQQAR